MRRRRGGNLENFVSLLKTTVLRCGALRFDCRHEDARIVVEKSIVRSAANVEAEALGGSFGAIFCRRRDASYLFGLFPGRFRAPIPSPGSYYLDFHCIFRVVPRARDVVIEKGLKSSQITSSSIVSRWGLRLRNWHSARKNAMRPITTLRSSQLTTSASCFRVFRRFFEHSDQFDGNESRICRPSSASVSRARSRAIFSRFWSHQRGQLENRLRIRGKKTILTEKSIESTLHDSYFSRGPRFRNSTTTRTQTTPCTNSTGAIFSAKGKQRSQSIETIKNRFVESSSNWRAVPEVGVFLFPKTKRKFTEKSVEATSCAAVHAFKFCSSRSFDKYGPPVRTDYRLTIDNLSSRTSWQVGRNVGREMRGGEGRGETDTAVINNNKIYIFLNISTYYHAL